MSSLTDNFSRVIDYLRISITDKCNLRCIYCMPSDGVVPAKQSDLLTDEEILRITKIAAQLGVKKIRLTGGEPLIRKNVIPLISSLKLIPGIEDLSLTTNGILLEQQAEFLVKAGLDRVNISIDSFKPERYREITRGGNLDAVMRGLREAEQRGLIPVKINMVPVRGLNEDEILDFARLTLDAGYHVRFIECMPTGGGGFWSPEKYIATDEIRQTIETLGPLESVRARKNGPSRYYRLKGAKGVIGFISALTNHFCEDCNRLRLTADGKLRPCLFSETEIDLRSVIRSGASDEEISRQLKLAVEVKPKEHQLNDTEFLQQASHPTSDSVKRPMSKIGG
jgi:cyclic pyranopterin phosphate synthase